MERSFRTSDGLQLHYDVDDFTDPWLRRPHLVMLHAAMGNSERFFGFVPHLSRDYRVVRLDLRGHGRSEIPGAGVPLAMPRLAQDVMELLDELKIDRAHLLGNSAGGFIAQNCALTAPDRVASLSLFSSPPGLKHSQAASWIPQIEAKGLRAFLAETIDDRFPSATTHPGLIRWFLDQTGRNDQTFICKFIGLMASLDWSDQLGRILCPTLMVVPGNETVGGSAIYEVMARQIPRSKLVTLDRLPHNICDAAPDRCAAEAVDFLNSLEHRDND